MTVGSRGLSVPHGEVFPVCVVGAQEGDVLIVRRACDMDILLQPCQENTTHHKQGKAILSPV